MRRCSFAACDKVHKAKGYCEKHYKQWKKGKLERPVALGKGNTKGRDGVRHHARGEGSRAATTRLRRPGRKVEQGGFVSADACCRVAGCNNPVKTYGYCPMHYSRLLLIIMVKNARAGLQIRAESHYEEDAQERDEVAYPEDLDEMESDSSIFLYDYLDKGLPSDSDYE